MKDEEKAKEQLIENFATSSHLEKPSINKLKRFFLNPLFLLIIQIVLIFFAEASVMLVLSILPPLSILKEALIDAFLLSFIIFPVLYFLVLKPLRLRIINSKEALLKAEKLSDAILSNMESGLMILDAEGRILKINQAGAEILKVSLTHAKGSSLTDLYPEAGLILSANKSLNREVTLSLPDSRKIPIGFRNSPFLDSFKKERGNIIIFRDLTDIKKLQEELRMKQHFETVGKVMAGVAHEIRNPLFGISSIGQILEKEVKSDKHQELLQAMLKEIFRLKNLVEEFLIYSRPTKLNIYKIDLSSIVEKIKHYLNARNPDVVLNIMAQPGIAIKADSDKLTQVFLNLVDNAVNADCKKIEISAQCQDKQAMVMIKDDGHGISEDVLENLFEPFFTTKKEGLGLGLSICKKIVEDHGGGIEIQSAQGVGTTVKLTLNSI